MKKEEYCVRSESEEFFFKRLRGTGGLWLLGLKGKKIFLRINKRRLLCGCLENRLCFDSETMNKRTGRPLGLRL
jgi:hypothetical protein